MRILQVVSIVPFPAAGPAYIEVAGDYTQLFHGKEWLDSTGNRFPYSTYTAANAPYTVRLLAATTFNLKENELYDGTYTVYTKQNALDYEPVELIGSNTRIRFNQTISPDGVGTQLTTGVVLNISTYWFEIDNEANKLIVEGDVFIDRPVEMVGRFYSGWGEVLLQNQIKQAQNFSGLVPPDLPMYGQFWFNRGTNILYVYTGAWAAVSTTINSPIIRNSIVGAAVTLSPASIGGLLRFEGGGAKTLTIDSASNHPAEKSYHISNRASSGDLTLVAAGSMVLNPPKGGLLVLEPGDTVSLLVVDSNTIDVFGSVKKSV